MTTPERLAKLNSILDVISELRMKLCDRSLWVEGWSILPNHVCANLDNIEYAVFFQLSRLKEIYMEEKSRGEKD